MYKCRKTFREEFCFVMQKLFSVLILISIFLIPSVSFAKDKDDNGKSAILIVSFGTSMPEARKAIDNLVNAAKSSFPDSEVRLAFTSNIIRRKLAKELNENISNIEKLNSKKIKDELILQNQNGQKDEEKEIEYQKQLLEKLKKLRTGE